MEDSRGVPTIESRGDVADGGRDIVFITGSWVREGCTEKIYGYDDGIGGGWET